MTRLQRELQRLYAAQPPEDLDTALGDTGLVDAEGRVRALVLGVAGPGAWAALSTVWSGVQADLDLPAPAIAVSGTDGYQLWFSLSAPVPAAQAAAFLDALRVRYLHEIKAARTVAMPTVDASSPPQVLHARPVPAQQEAGDRWSAFVAPDLAPVFAEEPWLDVPPNPDGQSQLLARLQSIPQTDFLAAMERLRPAPMPVERPTATRPAAQVDHAAGPTSPRPASGGAGQDPRRFLLDVMNDESVALGLRIEAAKALLPCRDRSPPG
jgi:hypothetical protein